MGLTPEQIKGRLKYSAKEIHADARILMRIYMMERFLERLANSRYADNFIIKGGMLVTSMVGVAMRSTMDIDTTIRNLNLSDENILRTVREISSIDIGDGITFTVKELSQIMDEMEYPGIRIAMDAVMGKMVTPLKIDISTGDAITPRAIRYDYQLLLEDRSIRLWSYNLETILAEKLQTILARGILNTRMRDFYDVHVLMAVYTNQIDPETLASAFNATCRKRSSVSLATDGGRILETIAVDDVLADLWSTYRAKYSYAADIDFESIIRSTTELYRKATCI